MKPAPAVRPFAWPLLAVLLAIYVVAETAFNFRLVDTVAAAEIDPDELDRLTTLGKLSGAFGLVLFGVRPVLQRLRRLRAWHAAAFLGAWAAAYGALTVVYETVLDRVPVEMQHEAFQLALYREAVFSGAIENPELRAREGALEDSHRLALVNLAARLTGDKPEILAVRDWLARGEMARLEGVKLDPRAEAALARARDAGDGTLRNATAAMFLPPMSMTLSLLAIVANLGARDQRRGRDPENVGRRAAGGDGPAFSRACVRAGRAGRRTGRASRSAAEVRPTRPCGAVARPSDPAIR